MWNFIEPQPFNTIIRNVLYTFVDCFELLNLVDRIKQNIKKLKIGNMKENFCNQKIEI